MMRYTREHLVEQLIKHSIASCTCGAKTPSLPYHHPKCHYLVISLAINILSNR